MLPLLKRADLLHTRVVEDARVRTTRGGLLFLIASITSTILALNSLNEYLSLPDWEYIERIEVDTDLSNRMVIDLDVTFPKLSCLDVELIALDVTGEAQLDTGSSLVKTRLDEAGEQLGDTIKGHLNRDKTLLTEKFEKHLAATKENSPCGSCYGAERSPTDCCRTCRDVKDRYSAKYWDEQKITREAEQCLREMDHPEIAVQSHEGCNIRGSVFVNKVAGNIHVALGSTRKIAGQVIHTFIQDQMGLFDTSHIINELKFGDESKYVGSLAGTSKYVDQTKGKTAAIQYFIHLVPTKYMSSTTYRFSVTEKYIPILEPSDKLAIHHNTENQKHSANNGPKAINRAFNLPGVYFIYDFSPFMVAREKYQIPLIELITDLLTVAGGVFVLVQILDSALHLTKL